VDHLAKDCEAIVADVQGSYSRRRLSQDPLKGDLRVGIEMLFKSAHELVEMKPGGAPDPRH